MSNSNLTGHPSSELYRSHTRRLMLLASLLVMTLTTSRPHDALAQQLILTADVGKAEFFEGEPIFLLVQFHAHWAIAQTQPLTLETPPLSFRIREGTAAEEREVKELEAVRTMAWDRFPRYEAALIEWVARHQTIDPFLPYLLSSWLYEV